MERTPLVDLWIVRHATAEPRRADLADRDRDLTDDGVREAQALAGGLPPLDHLYVSPALRARRTADAIAHLAPAGPEALDALWAGDGADLPDALARMLRVGPSASASSVTTGGRPLRLGVVGHAPMLAEAAGLLIAPYRADQPARLHLAKAGVAHLVGTLEPGGMELRLLLGREDVARFA
ncbi:MAG: histidine phosphatase family protein [Trueperaceae bacterium]|nr:histidine phosphatase family protein [Trueperaceae bacterium]